MLQVDVNRADIGVITPFRQQVKLLREGLRCSGHSDVEVNTVDQYQGRDKSVVIISFVKLAKSTLPTVSTSIHRLLLY